MAAYPYVKHKSYVIPVAEAGGGGVGEQRRAGSG
jgi:hypothetical protein